MQRNRVLLTVIFGSIIFQASDALSQGEATEYFDHHVHILSPALISHWKSTGMRFSRADELYSDPLVILAKENLKGAFLISMAHLYTTEGFRGFAITHEVEHQLVAAENVFVAACVAKAPDRLVGFFSVNPLRNYAEQEMERCRRNPSLIGLKLHLPACGVNLNNGGHLSRIKEVFAWAERGRVPILLHWTSGESIDAPKAWHFWSELVKPHKQLELYLAHLGSVGGYNESSRVILNGFARLCAEDEAFQKSGIYFDLSGAIIPEGSDEAAPTSDESGRLLGDQMRRIGIERFLFASDYPVFSVSGTIQGLTQKLGFDDRERSLLLRNRSPRFRGPN